MPRLILLDNQPSGLSSLALGAAEGIGQSLIQQEQRRNALADRRAVLGDQLAIQNEAANRRETFAREQATTGYNRQVEMNKVRADLMDKNYQRSRQDHLWDQVDAQEQRAEERAAMGRRSDAQLGREMARDQETFNERAYDNERANNALKLQEGNAAESGRHNRAMEANAAAGQAATGFRAGADDYRSDIQQRIAHFNKLADDAQEEAQSWDAASKKPGASKASIQQAYDEWTKAIQRRNAARGEAGKLLSGQPAAPRTAPPPGGGTNLDAIEQALMAELEKLKGGR